MLTTETRVLKTFHRLGLHLWVLDSVTYSKSAVQGNGRILDGVTGQDLLSWQHLSSLCILFCFFSTCLVSGGTLFPITK